MYSIEAGQHSEHSSCYRSHSYASFLIHLYWIIHPFSNGIVLTRWACCLYWIIDTNRLHMTSPWIFWRIRIGFVFFFFCLVTFCLIWRMYLWWIKLTNLWWNINGPLFWLCLNSLCCNLLYWLHVLMPHQSFVFNEHCSYGIVNILNRIKLKILSLKINLSNMNALVLGCKMFELTLLCIYEHDSLFNLYTVAFYWSAK